MTSSVKCECGKLSGIATIKIVDLRPTLAWDLQGSFFNKEKGERGPFCIECKKPALGNEWK